MVHSAAARGLRDVLRQRPPVNPGLHQYIVRRRALTVAANPFHIRTWLPKFLAKVMMLSVVRRCGTDVVRSGNGVPPRRWAVVNRWRV